MSDIDEHDGALPVRVTVRLSRLAAARLRALAAERGTTVSRVIRAAIDDQAGRQVDEAPCAPVTIGGYPESRSLRGT